jgi:hypothetical protein
LRSGSFVVFVVMMLAMLVKLFGHGGGGHEPADKNGAKDDEEGFFAQHKCAPHKGEKFNWTPVPIIYAIVTLLSR